MQRYKFFLGFFVDVSSEEDAAKLNTKFALRVNKDVVTTVPTTTHPQHYFCDSEGKLSAIHFESDKFMGLMQAESFGRVDYTLIEATADSELIKKLTVPIDVAVKQNFRQIKEKLQNGGLIPGFVNSKPNIALTVALKSENNATTEKILVDGVLTTPDTEEKVMKFLEQQHPKGLLYQFLKPSKNPAEKNTVAINGQQKVESPYSAIAPVKW